MFTFSIVVIDIGVPYFVQVIGGGSAHFTNYWGGVVSPLCSLPTSMYVTYVRLFVVVPNARRLHDATCNVYAINVFTFSIIEEFISLRSFSTSVVELLNSTTICMSTLAKIVCSYVRKFTPLVVLTPLADNFMGARAPCAPVVPPPMMKYIVFIFLNMTRIVGSQDSICLLSFMSFREICLCG